MAAMGQYDSTLQMFVQTPQPIDMSKVSFMRWLAEQGKLEHEIAGPSSGPLVSSPEGGQAVSVAAALRRNVMGIPAQTADRGGWFPDGQTSGFPEGGQPIRFRR